MNGVNENDSTIVCTSSVFEDDSETSGILTTTTSDTDSDTSYSDNNYLSAIYETSVQSLVVQYAILLLVIIGGLARLMHKFFE